MPLNKQSNYELLTYNILRIDSGDISLVKYTRDFTKDIVITCYGIRYAENHTIFKHQSTISTTYLSTYYGNLISVS